ncbi:MAG: porin [Cytophagales bacterium]|nr:porin [Cytophagales bacterium]
MKRTIYCLSLLLLSLIAAHAQDSTAAKGQFTFSGYLDTYYFKNLNNPQSGYNFGSSGFARVFDQREGQFQLGLAQTKIAYSNAKSEAVIDLVFGPNADLGNYGNVFSLNAAAQTSTALAIKQAYFTYKATSKLSFTAGQFGTHIGYEVIDAPVNYNYSLSNLFANGPFYHLGLKANYAINDKVGVMAGIVNNWDSNFDNNKFKTAIAQLYFAPVSGWNVYVNWIGGEETTPDGAINITPETRSFKQMFDLTTSFQVTDRFLLGLNSAYGIYKVEDVDAQSWGGAALYANYALTDVFGLGLRGEVFDNTAGVQYMNTVVGEDDAGGTILAGTNVTSLTATGNITLAEGHLLLKPEIRVDMVKKVEGAGFESYQQFEDSNGNFTKNSQTTVGVAFVYKF